MTTIYAIISLVIGLVLGLAIKHFLTPKNRLSKADFEELMLKNKSLETEKEKFLQDIESLNKNQGNLKEEIEAKNIEIRELSSNSAVLNNELKSSKERLDEISSTLKNLESEKENLQRRDQELNKLIAENNIKIDAQNKEIADKQNRLNSLEENLKAQADELLDIKQKYSAQLEQNKSLNEKLNTQKDEINDLGEKFTKEFENLANKILEEKSKKFSEQNQTNIKQILDPLKENIDSFKKKVEEVYNTESKERFSLSERVKELAQLNEQINQEAKNLTQALKGSVKQQGNWGEMILESILENSGLVRDREFFAQEFIRDEADKTVKDEDGRRMQPDVVVKLPDDREIVIDSKVSLVAYERYSNAEDVETQNNELDNHVNSIKAHINDLDLKNYQDHLKSLDFVMMFIPIEPAYIAAVQHDKELWEYAYRKRILLISPTNLIATLKLIADLWKREQQSQNALQIAERGAYLYDKFVGFVENFEKIGDTIERSQKSYQAALGQLKDGPGNLIRQAEMLRELGVKSKKTIPSSLSENSVDSDTDIEDWMLLENSDI
ncbi:MAG: DNA recombination protein RmuC [Bacteroidales bacterium]|jgi:DNA recombination protein RmuC|nr:DNA recombination protein RmuC [Bacteroidales bacterium]